MSEKFGIERLIHETVCRMVRRQSIVGQSSDFEVEQDVKLYSLTHFHVH